MAYAAYYRLCVLRVRKVVESVHALLPLLVAWAIDAQLFDTAYLAVPMRRIEFVDRQILANVPVHATQITGGEIVEIAVHPGEMCRFRAVEQGQRRLGRAVIVEVERDKAERRFERVLQPVLH